MGGNCMGRPWLPWCSWRSRSSSQDWPSCNSQNDSPCCPQEAHLEMLVRPCSRVWLEAYRAMIFKQRNRLAMVVALFEFSIFSAGWTSLWERWRNLFAVQILLEVKSRFIEMYRCYSVRVQELDLEFALLQDADGPCCNIISKK